MYWEQTQESIQNKSICDKIDSNPKKGAKRQQMRRQDNKKNRTIPSKPLDARQNDRMGTLT